MTDTLSDRITKSKEGMQIWQQERIIFEATERICELMEIQEVSKAELSRSLGKSKSYITQLLDGQANMTLRTLSDVFTSLNRAVHLSDEPITTELKSIPQVEFTLENQASHSPLDECEITFDECYITSQLTLN